MTGPQRNCLTGAFCDQHFPNPATRVFDDDKKRHQDEKDISDPRLRFESWPPRERQMMRFVTARLMNKRPAAEAGARERAARIHWRNTTKIWWRIVDLPNVNGPGARGQSLKAMTTIPRYGLRDGRWYCKLSCSRAYQS
jgi:hypothetical protein